MGKRSQGARGAGSAGAASISTAATTAMRMPRQQKTPPTALIFLLVSAEREVAMGLVARFWQYSVDTYGGAPLLLLINLVQVAILGWVVSQALRAQADRVAAGMSKDARRIRAARRAEIWQKQVRPVAMTMMLLGPGLGLGMSTLVGALGMGALGDAMGIQAGADVLAQTMARAYREISYAYFLMVGGKIGRAHV